MHLCLISFFRLVCGGAHQESTANKKRCRMLRRTTATAHNAILIIIALKWYTARRTSYQLFAFFLRCVIDRTVSQRRKK